MIVRDDASTVHAHLTAPGLEDALTRLLTAHLALLADGRVVTEQPQLQLGVLPTLPEDQALVATHVARYRDHLGAHVLDVFDAADEIASLVAGMLPALRTNAAVLDGGSPGTPAYTAALTAFRDQLSALAAAATSLDPNGSTPAVSVADCAAALESFLDNEIANDATRFATAVQEIGEAHDITTLQTQISSLQTQIGGLDHDIAKGATSQIGPALQFGFDIGKTFATSTSSGSLLLGVAMTIRDEAKSGNTFAAQMRAKNAQVSSLITQLGALIAALDETREEIACVLTIAGRSQSFGSRLTDAHRAVGLVATQIALLARGIAYLQTVDQAPSAGWFTAQIDAAGTAWAAVSSAVANDLTFARSL